MHRLLVPLPTHLTNIQHGSGTFASIYKSLAEVFELVPVGPFTTNKNLFYAGFNYLHKRGLFPWRFPVEHRWQTIQQYAAQLQPALTGQRYDAIFTTSTLIAAGIETDKPVFAYTDFSFFNAVDYYDFGTNLFPKAKKEALEMDKYCFNRHTKVFLASEWAKKTTMEAYQLSNSKIISVGRGANLTSGFNGQQLHTIIKKRVAADRLNFLFAGINWKRKGGDKAFEIVNSLRSHGINAVLQIVGCTPPAHVAEQKFVEAYPFLNRANEQELLLLKNLFSNAWIFILPSRAEAMGIVLAEAASFGLPAISCNTGGIGTAVEHNKTGLLFNPSDTVSFIVPQIINIIQNKSLYQQLSENAFEKYRQQLNWSTIAQKIKNEITDCLI